MAVILDVNQMLYQSFEPTLENRFILSIEGIPAYMIKSVNGIGFEQGEVMIHHINSYFKVKGGKKVWQDLTLELYDPITPSGSRTVMNWAEKHHETTTGRAGYADMYKKDFNIYTLGPVGDIVEEWLVKGSFIKSATFGNYNWETDDAARNISMTVAMDNIIHNSFV